MTLYEERLRAPRWSWPAGLALALLLAAPVHGGAGGWRAVVPYVVAVVVTVAVLVRASRGQVRVSDGVLHVPGARVPVEHVGEVQALTPDQTRRLLGPEAHPFAHVAVRPWLRRAVLVAIDDPEDDTPYWLVGTRRPEGLAGALREALSARGRAPGA